MLIMGVISMAHKNRVFHFDILSIELSDNGKKIHHCHCRLCGNNFDATSYQLNGITHCGCAKNGCLNEFEICGDYAKMWSRDLTKYTLVDTEDIPLLKSFNRTWSRNKQGYWMIDRPHAQLHRVVMKAKESELVDHKHRNTDDNRKCELRICSHSENSFNVGENPNRDFPTGVRLRYNGKYNAYIKKGSIRKVKDFPTFEEALNQRKEWEKELYGDFIKY